jgi:hypothetical protein
MTLEEMEMALRERVAALPLAARAEPLHVLTLPDLDRAERIGEYWAAGNIVSRNFAELLIDCEEDRATRAILVGMLREHPTGHRLG